MNKIIIGLLFLFSLISLNLAQEAIAFLKGTDNYAGISGQAIFTTVTGGVNVTLTITGVAGNLRNARHGIHIHQYGDISNTALANNTGGHYNPNGVTHGCPGVNTTWHVGDMGDVFVDQNGEVSVTIGPFNLLTLTGVTSIIGRAVIFHASPDDCTDPVGNAGARLAQGVIGIRSGETVSNNGDTATTYASCELAGSAGNAGINGRVTFTSTVNGVVVQAQINGLVDGSVHGLHIHQFGDLSFTNGSSLGGHYNPTGSIHGIPPTSARHVGDMGNLYHYEGGVAYYKYTNTLVSLVGANSIIGRGVVLHANPDDCSDPVGNAGARLGFCVIGIANSGYAPLSLPATVPETQNNTLCPLATTSVMTTGVEMTTGSASPADNSSPSSFFSFALLFFASFLALFF